MKQRNSTELRKTMTDDEYNQFCKKLLEEYANTEAEYARTYFTKKYNITESCYQKVKQHAIVTNLVEDAIVKKAMNKAIQNQRLHSEGMGLSTLVKYSKMYTQRCKYIADTFSDEEVERIAIDFGDNPDISKCDFAASYGIPIKSLEFILEKAIEKNKANNRTVDAIEKRSIDNAIPQNLAATKKYFKLLRKNRELNKKETAL